MSDLIKTDNALRKRPCWNCRVEITDLYFCPSCASLLPLPEKIDYFRCLGLDYRLEIDREFLEETFYGLSRKFHPDLYQKKPQEERRISLENAAILNRAYRTLRDPLKRVAYLIGLAEGKGDIPTEAPADLFDEILELQEGLEKAKGIAPSDADQKASLFQTLEAEMEKLQARQDQGVQQLEALSEKWDRLEASRQDRAFTEAQMACLREMKKVLSHRAYLERIINEIRTTVEGD
ncbi:MAG: Fe-S protein assembly co-chaperone HscB [Nitrospiria bacterium]